MPASNLMRNLVIDANVARASGGETAIHPTSKRCRDFLRSVLDVCHRIVMTDDLIHEWNNHQSRFARRWRTQMTSRKKVIRIDVKPDRELRTKLKRVGSSNTKLNAMLKDIHLIEAAETTDKTIISLDDAVRELFRTASGTDAQLKHIVWVNPSKTKERPLDWLQKGAKAEKSRKLHPSRH